MKLLSLVLPSLFLCNGLASSSTALPLDAAAPSSGELGGENDTLHKRQYYIDRDWNGLNQVSVSKLTVGQTLQALYRHSHYDVFGIGEDNQIYTAWLEQATWHGWFAIPMSNLAISKTTQLSLLWRGPIDSIHRTDTHLDLFVVDTDGVVKTTYWEGEWLGSWFAIPSASLFSPGSKVTPIWRKDAHLDLFLVDSGGVAWTTYWEPATGWQPWTNLWGKVSLRFGSSISAVWRQESHLDLFAVGYDGRIYNAWWEYATGWNLWKPFSDGTVLASEVAASGSSGYSVVVVPNLDDSGRLFTKTWKNGAWGFWQPIDTPDKRYFTTESPVRITAGNNVFAVDNKGNMAHVNAAWQGYDDINMGYRGRDVGPVSGMETATSSHLVIFKVGPEGKPYWASFTLAP